MTCKQCKNLENCMYEADIIEQEFDPNLEGQDRCFAFSAITNGYHIRSMTDEELADFLEGEFGNMVTGTALRWLKEPKEDKHIPAADVAPVVHGAWDDSGRYRFHDGTVAVRCSICGCSISIIEYIKCHWNYCPVCGAKMDGKD